MSLYKNILRVLNEDTFNNPDIERIFFVPDSIGRENACVKIKGFDKPLRGRSELLIIKGDTIYLVVGKKGFSSTKSLKYEVPGGAWDKGETHDFSAKREAREESFITVQGNPMYCGNYTLKEKLPRAWVVAHVKPANYWYGYYTEVYVAKYAGKYTGKVAKHDQEKAMTKGQFYKIDEVYNKLHPVHRKAIDAYRAKMSGEKPEEVTNGEDKVDESSIVDLEDYVVEEVIEEDFNELLTKIKNWKVANEAERYREFKTTSLSDKDYDMMKEIFRSLHEDDYAQYKKSFDKLCNFCHIVPKGTIITKHKLKKGSTDKNTLYIQYSYNTKKIDIPNDVALYHMSKIGGIKNLKPFFRGKSERGYLYDKPRIYFTIHKNLPKLAADYAPTEKMYKYKCKRNIAQAYVDPLLRTGFMGAVYVETDSPIPVESIN